MTYPRSSTNPASRSAAWEGFRNIVPCRSCIKKWRSQKGNGMPKLYHTANLDYPWSIPMRFIKQTSERHPPIASNCLDVKCPSKQVFFPWHLGKTIILNHREPVIRDRSGWVLGFFRGHEVVTVTVLAFGDREVPGNSCNPVPSPCIYIYTLIY